MQRSQVLKQSFRLTFLTFLFSLCLGSVHAQGTSGTVAGTVTDSTDAIVPGATVKISNVTSACG